MYLLFDGNHGYFQIEGKGIIILWVFWNSKPTILSVFKGYSDKYALR